MTSMSEAMAAKFEQQHQAAADRQTFTPDPELERLAARLDQLREDNPSEYEAAGLATLRTRVTTYRRRKAQHEENTK